MGLPRATVPVQTKWSPFFESLFLNSSIHGRRTPGLRPLGSGLFTRLEREESFKYFNRSRHASQVTPCHFSVPIFFPRIGSPKEHIDPRK
jgi:hypothetical protein